MIISASRRTDIPAHFPEWFCQRLAEEFCLVRNPYSKKITHVSLKKEDVDAVVFWTKNAGPMLSHLSKIDASSIPYYFQYTITPYGPEIETNLNKDHCIENFLALSSIIGKDRVLWRYDPILITKKYSTSFHEKAFEKFCEKFSDATSRCTISFVDSYPSSPFRECTISEKNFLAEKFSVTAKNFGIPLMSCAEGEGLRTFGITPASCIDKDLCEKLCGSPLTVKKDPQQRPSCGCVKSVDIGGYHTCRNGCLYCYACGGKMPETHDQHSPLISGFPNENELISHNNIPNSSDCQTRLSFK
ncbi:DUF1848 domain-containing protein [Methanorbis furvi]|uniref:DUF1848 domain-containing protein n=1 Tax=Methanorbis furvi TaxID=3028299 RepID=A0AAE4S971_9EURY|nr:hypothetical protein [Methanocorpusculaceae archaeon Ag1]